jgi:3-phenylpropionate/trans-cinnamate dioxygenase ferredoxin reductase subunit
LDLSGSQKIVIIGGGQAGAQAAQSLRLFGYEGDLVLVGDEQALPYQRPPLSKAYMKGELGEDRLYFKPAAWYEDNRIETLLSQQVERIDRANRQVRLNHGGHLDYDALIIATGSRPRALPVDGADLENVFDLRGLADVEHIQPKMIPGRRLVIVGAGYIGLEAAAVACQLGLEVTVLEMEQRALARVTSPVISAFYERLHMEHGVDVRCGARLASLKGKDGKVTHAVLASGEEIEADMVLAGIGILPNVELASEAGLPCRDGIIVNEDAQTSDPHIFAAGDCTVRPLAHYARTGRLESVHNAIEQGKLAAAAIMGKPRPNIDCPWFWSDQYDVKLQIAGLSMGHDEIVVRGSEDEKKFAVFYLKAGRLIAVDAINSPPEFIASKRLIMSGASVAPDVLKDTSISMKEIAANAA